MKKRWEKGEKDREAVERDLRDISEQYSELINQFNQMKDNHRQGEGLQSELE